MSTGIGEELVAARREAGVSLTDAAGETRIRESYLRALEDEDFDYIGSDVYVTGFIRSYARYLRLDPEPLIDAYRVERPREDPVNAPGAPLESPPGPRRPIAVIVVVVAVFVLGGLAFLALQADGEEEADGVAAPDPVEDETELPPDPSATAEPEADTEDDDATTEPDDENAEEAGGPDDGDGTEEPTDPPAGPDLREEVVLTLSLRGSGSWARVTVDGATVAEGLYEGGYEETYNGDEVLVRIGDAGNADVEVNGEPLGAIGGSGEVVEVQCSTSSGSCQVEVVA